MSNNDNAGINVEPVRGNSLPNFQGYMDNIDRSQNGLPDEMGNVVMKSQSFKMPDIGQSTTLSIVRGQSNSMSFKNTFRPSLKSNQVGIVTEDVTRSPRVITKASKKDIMSSSVHDKDLITTCNICCDEF